jgi:hypothetical protein
MGALPKTSVWHFGEWQWWKGDPWGDSCRPRYYANVRLTARRDKSDAAIVAYRIDGFYCRQVFMLPPVIEQDAPGIGTDRIYQNYFPTGYPVKPRRIISRYACIP